MSALEAAAGGQDQAIASLQQQNATQAQQIATLQQQNTTQTQQILGLTKQIMGLQSLNLTVDCNAGQTVAGALSQAGQRASLVVITISGVCAESVAINRNNTELRGAAPGDGLQAPSAQVNVLSIGARDVSVTGLTLSGGTGVIIGAGSAVRMVNSRVVGSSFHGMSIFSAFVDLSSTTVEGNAILGIHAMSGSLLRLQGGLIQSNGGGLGIANGSFVLLNGGTHVVGNGSGASVNFGSTLHVGNATIENNNLSGVDLAGGSVAHFGFGGGVGVVRGNGGHGLMLLDTSVASSSFEGGTAQIVDNAGFGVFCSGPPAVAQISGQIGTVSGNTLGDINCPISQ